MGSCRFLGNSRVKVSDLEKGIISQSNIACKGKDILCLQDTTEYNFGRNNTKIKSGELGIVGNNNIGFFAHPTLLVDANDFQPLGYSAINLYIRKAGNPKTKDKYYSQIPIENRESYKWINSIEQSFNDISTAKSKTIIGDREFDMYYSFIHNLDQSTHVLTRARFNRKLVNSNFLLYEFLDNQPINGTIKLEVKANKKEGRSTHQAKLEIKFAAVEIKRPSKVPSDLPTSVQLYVVEVKESKETVKKGEPKVLWRLLTTHKVIDLPKAIKMVEWYKARWQIEELFAITKTRAFNIESSQLETKLALFKLTMLVFVAALKVLQLVKGREKENYKASIVFNQQEIELLNLLLQEYEGNTEKQKNPYLKYSLAWASWVIGRMGGWKGYKSESPPGTKTMKRGLDKLENMLEITKLIK